MKNKFFGLASLLTIAVLFTPASASTDEKYPFIRDEKGRVLLNVYECGGSVPDLSKWRIYQTMEYLNEDGSGERTTYFVDRDSNLGLGMSVDLIHTDGTIEPMLRIVGLATANEMTAYLKNSEWFCFAGTASWLTVSSQEPMGRKVAIYYIAENKDGSMRKVEIHKWHHKQILGKVLIWNWQPHKDIHDGKKKYPDAPEIELASWTIKN